MMIDKKKSPTFVPAFQNGRKKNASVAQLVRAHDC